MISNGRTGKGILALWRQGSAEVPSSPFDPETGRTLHRIGAIGILALARAAYESVGFEYPGVRSLVGDEFPGADQLNETARVRNTGVVHLGHKDMRDFELETARATLTTGYTTIVGEARNLAGVDVPLAPPDCNPQEQTRLAHMGALYIPTNGVFELSGALRQLGLGVPAPVAQ